MITVSMHIFMFRPQIFFSVSDISLTEDDHYEKPVEKDAKMNILLHLIHLLKDRKIKEKNVVSPHYSVRNETVLLRNSTEQEKQQGSIAKIMIIIFTV